MWARRPDSVPARHWPTRGSDTDLAGAAREIVLRKLYGAGRVRIAALPGRGLGMPIGVAVMPGPPLAFIAIGRYQAGFVEHAASITAPASPA